MNELKINDRFRLLCPEGFRPLSEEERDRLNASDDAGTLYLINDDHRMIVSMGWKKVSALSGLLLYVIRPVKSVEAGVYQSMSSYGFKKETALTRRIANESAEGFRYTYTAGEDPMVGESYVVRQGRDLTFFHVYLPSPLREEGLPLWNGLLDDLQAL